MLKHLSAAAATAVCLVSGASMALAQVATIGKTVGTVLVNHGSGFVPAPPGSPLAPGDIVSVRRGGRVVLDYVNGCAVTVRPGRSVTVGQTACAAETPLPGDSAAAGAGAPGGALLVGGGLALAGIGTGIALALTQNRGAPGGGGGGNGNPNPPMSR